MLAGSTVDKSLCLFLKFAIELSGEAQWETIRMKVSFLHSSFRSLSLSRLPRVVDLGWLGEVNV